MNTENLYKLKSFQLINNLFNNYNTIELKKTILSIPLKLLCVSYRFMWNSFFKYLDQPLKLLIYMCV